MPVEISRVLQNGDRVKMEIRGGPAGNRAGLTPAFAVTGEFRSKEWKFREAESVGAIHGILLRAFPWAAPIIKLHLSDEEGVPLHAIDNGWYWVGGTRWNKDEVGSPPNASNLAKHLRISQDDAQKLIDAVLGHRMTKDMFATYVDTQRPRWKQEAHEVCALIRAQFGILDLGVGLPDTTSSPKP